MRRVVVSESTSHFAATIVSAPAIIRARGHADQSLPRRGPADGHVAGGENDQLRREFQAQDFLAVRRPSSPGLASKAR